MVRLLTIMIFSFALLLNAETPVYNGAVAPKVRLNSAFEGIHALPLEKPRSLNGVIALLDESLPAAEEASLITTKPRNNVQGCPPGALEGTVLADYDCPGQPCRIQLCYVTGDKNCTSCDGRYDASDCSRLGCGHQLLCTLTGCGHDPDAPL